MEASGGAVAERADAAGVRVFARPKADRVLATGESRCIR